MAVKIGSARIDENGKAKGGKAGDQTGREVSTQSWYDQKDAKKTWRVFRAKNPAQAEMIAQDMQWACDNAHIGYDQGQRGTLYDVSKPLGFNCAKVKTDCETDCSALVRVCCAYAGIMLPNFRTPTEPAALLNSGAFEELRGDMYSHSSAYLRRGDILVTSTQGHTVVVLSNGPKAEPTAEGLRRGDYGTAVTAMQKLLLKWDKTCLPKCGADGDFGSETERAVKDFQCTHDLPITGVYDEKTRDLLTGMYGEPGTEPPTPAPTVQMVEITGGSVNVRSGPGTSNTRILGTVHKGDRLPYQGESRFTGGYDWYLVEFAGQNGWVSGKYTRVVS